MKTTVSGNSIVKLTRQYSPEELAKTAPNGVYKPCAADDWELSGWRIIITGSDSARAVLCINPAKTVPRLDKFTECAWGANRRFVPAEETLTITFSPE